MDKRTSKESGDEDMTYITTEEWLTRFHELDKRARVEGLRLAQQVLAGVTTRRELEQALEDTGDREPAIALEYLDLLNKAV